MWPKTFTQKLYIYSPIGHKKATKTHSKESKKKVWLPVSLNFTRTESTKVQNRSLLTMASNNSEAGHITIAVFSGLKNTLYFNINNAFIAMQKNGRQTQIVYTYRIRVLAQKCILPFTCRVNKRAAKRNYRSHFEPSR